MPLPTDSQARKEIPLHRGVLKYFPAALAGVAKISYAGNQKHNPGEEMHHARGKSNDHGDCILRHLMDLDRLTARPEATMVASPNYRDAILEEASCLAWRALALSQELHERFGGAELAPGAKLPKTVATIDVGFPCPQCDAAEGDLHEVDCGFYLANRRP